MLAMTNSTKCKIQSENSVIYTREYKSGIYTEKINLTLKFKSSKWTTSFQITSNKCIAEFTVT